MDAFVAAGITTFDCADIYTGVEALIGDWRASRRAGPDAIQVHTKYVPDLDRLPSHSRADVVRGEHLSLPDGQPFSLYALAALLPLLPAKQRPTHANDWMTTDTEIACPDPNCGARFHITRIGRRAFRHRDVTAVPLSQG